MALLTIKNLSVGYEGIPVVRGLNFEVNQGDYLFVVGENGSGKSTLMKTLLGLQKPVSGEIIFGEGLKDTEIGYLPQRTETQKDFPASVKEVVLSGCQASMGLRPFYGKKEKETALMNMKKLNIEDLADRSYRNLSGGQQQRVLLARALCAARRILLMDEPVTGLDPAAAADMYQTILDLNREGIAIIMISHDPAAAEKYASHILKIDTGEGELVC